MTNLEAKEKLYNEWQKRIVRVFEENIQPVIRDMVKNENKVQR